MHDLTACDAFVDSFAAGPGLSSSCFYFHFLSRVSIAALLFLIFHPPSNSTQAIPLHFHITPLLRYYSSPRISVSVFITVRMYVIYLYVRSAVLIVAICTPSMYKLYSFHCIQILYTPYAYCAPCHRFLILCVRCTPDLPHSRGMNEWT